jgi:hypothetical protein
MHTPTPFSSRPGLTLKRRETPPTRSPFGSSNPFDGMTPNSDPYGQTSLQTAWDKLYRARALLEAEQAHLRDDRITFQGELEDLGRREEALAARELRLQQIELQVSLDQQDAQDEKDSKSTIARLTQAPFDMARSVFGSKK